MPQASQSRRAAFSLAHVTSRYTHVVDMAKRNPPLFIPVNDGVGAIMGHGRTCEA
ncbi:hypothetical protein SBA4_20024 [Candidatus Sulfopaludibacter sp. SbA4]|nr:hypothetical protein SBA4_20024 [Candidatus Sulfopaludibacter sp. SbA4]